MEVPVQLHHSPMACNETDLLGQDDGWPEPWGGAGPLGDSWPHQRCRETFIKLLSGPYDTKIIRLRRKKGGARKGASLLDLSWLAVHARQQQPGRLPHVVAVNREAAAVLGVRHRHPDPLH